MKARGVLRGLVFPLVIALPPLVWVAEATRRASLTTLGRDQGIFQYVAWALGRGLKDYRDIRDVNGPLTHLVHMVFLALGGADEHRFHVLDLTVTGATFALAGACLPGLVATDTPLGDAKARAARWLERVGWAFAAWVILSAQYLAFLYWDLAQRESFFDWFMLSGVALQLFAQSRLARSPAPGKRHLETALLAVAGALSLVPWFGKPTYALFTFAQLAALLLDPDAALSRRRRFAAFALGGLAGALTQVAFLLAYADIGAFVRIYLVDVPALYQFIWPRTPAEILTLPAFESTSALALVTSAVMLGLIADRQLPVRALAVALVPICGLANAVLQRKGFPYHLHPVSAGLHLEWLVLAVWACERYGRSDAAASERSEKRAALPGQRLITFVAAGVLTLRVAMAMETSPHLTNLWILQKGTTAELRTSHDYLVYFRDRDYFPWEMRQTAAYLREHTRPTDRVQMYGMDPYLLFLAERLSATPYIYAYDLDVDAALYGSNLPEGLHPTWEESVRIRDLRDAHERDFLERLKKDPPAAFVFMDKAPLMTVDDDAWLDFATHNASSAAWVSEHYKQTAAFGEDRVWLRTDLAEGVAEVQEPPSRGEGP